MAASTPSSRPKRFRPDIILLDVMMPEIDGFATAERLRVDPATAMTPIIFLSARGATADKLRAFSVGAEDYIVKPFVAEEMLARVKKALERRELELGASPTTQLPGSSAIESEIERRLRTEDAAFCYLDLDNLKAFNDYYGYAKADSVIRQTGDLVRDVVRRVGGPTDFIGHIAGDDFVFITSASQVDAVCRTICETFDQLDPALLQSRRPRARLYRDQRPLWCAKAVPDHGRLHCRRHLARSRATASSHRAPPRARRWPKVSTARRMFATKS